ncbi:hypothetical protein [Sphingobium sp. MI1205]|uniref:hypothetical protein n=1 Tax=Sphingobium sp. MI1205 TaxID=407020 RepID=UPI0007700D96|nr:hypothetical protein [Sphingobium sp. MI1205]AMK19337.1 hypothetical protein K663_14795 [Sphingobium sp. MI1205]
MSDEIRLMIATHTHGSVTPAYAQSLALTAAALAAHGVPHVVVLFEDSLVDRGRDRAAAAMLEGGFTHLLFIDADIEFRPHDVIRLLADDKDLVVGAYKKKNERDEYAISFLPDAAATLEQCPDTGTVKIARAGTGFMMIRRTVFEQLRYAMPELHYVDHSTLTGSRPMVAYFEHIVRDGRRWSEDYTFCERWRAIGGDIWLDTAITLGHWGPHVWRGSILDHIHVTDTTSSAA